MTFKIKSNSNVRFQGIIENESCSTTWVNPKTVFEPHIELENSPLDLKKSETNPKLSQNQVSELKETENKKCCTIWVDAKTIWTWPTTRNSLFFCHKKPKKLHWN